MGVLNQCDNISGPWIRVLWCPNGWFYNDSVRFSVLLLCVLCSAWLGLIPQLNPSFTLTHSHHSNVILHMFFWCAFHLLQLQHPFLVGCYKHLISASSLKEPGGMLASWRWTPKLLCKSLFAVPKWTCCLWWTQLTPGCTKSCLLGCADGTLCKSALCGNATKLLYSEKYLVLCYCRLIPK